MTVSSAADPIMDAIGRAVTDGQAGNTAAARREPADLWSTIGVSGDQLHRCALAHSMPDLYEDPAQALAWDIRAMDAAEAIAQWDTSRRVSAPGPTA